MIAIGPNLKKALALALEVETLAAMYWRALQVGKPVILPDDEIERVGQKFGTMGYGAVEATAGQKGKAAWPPHSSIDRSSVVAGKGVSVRGNLGGWGIMKKKQINKCTSQHNEQTKKE